MKLVMLVESYNSNGGEEVTTLAAEFLTQYLQQLPPESLTVEVTACLRSSRAPHRTLRSMWRAFHDSLAGLPQVRYSPKRGRLRIRYASRLGAEQVLHAADPVRAVEAASKHGETALEQEALSVLDSARSASAVARSRQLENEAPVEMLRLVEDFEVGLGATLPA